jgi:hypothetical protein
MLKQRKTAADPDNIALAEIHGTVIKVNENSTVDIQFPAQFWRTFEVDNVKLKYLKLPSDASRITSSGEVLDMSWFHMECLAAVARNDGWGVERLGALASYGLLVETRRCLLNAALDTDNFAAVEYLVQRPAFSDWQDWVSQFEPTVTKRPTPPRADESADLIRRAIRSHALKCLKLFLVAQGQTVPTKISQQPVVEFVVQSVVRAGAEASTDQLEVVKLIVEVTAKQRRQYYATLLTDQFAQGNSFLADLALKHPNGLFVDVVSPIICLPCVATHPSLGINIVHFMVNLNAGEALRALHKTAARAMFDSAIQQRDVKGNLPVNLAANGQADSSLLDSLLGFFEESCVLKNGAGDTPLHLAASKLDYLFTSPAGYVETVVRRMEHFTTLTCHADDTMDVWNVENEAGMTPLHVAISKTLEISGSDSQSKKLAAAKRTIEEMIDAGCDLFRTNTSGVSPLYLALHSPSKWKALGLDAYFQRALGQPNDGHVQQDLKSLPLHAIVAAGDEQLVRRCLVFLPKSVLNVIPTLIANVVVARIACVAHCSQVDHVAIHSTFDTLPLLAPRSC